ncbi:hypothetical protein [Cryobacterium sp. Y57]|uniref:hypothetical protein n=1 Tax=Cryobacterium sp. Y57 TaxID=2048287 RepID=UPI000CE45CA5|nr:hypothetical protein [Cryobacterium sp. Y57]
MSDEIELVSDGEGLAILGKKSAVERFLRDRGLLPSSENFSLDKVRSSVQVAEAMANGLSEIAASSGRWVKLTKESAELVKEFGLMESTTRGVKHAMIGDRGSISKWLQIDSGSGALVTNPAVLAGAAGVMAQIARQQEMREIQAYLGQIDTKVAAVLRAQKDAELARLFGTRRSIERAMSVREEQGGRTDRTTWSTVQDRVGAVDDLLSWAILGLDRVAIKLDGVAHAGERVRIAKSAENDVAEFLAVIAHCFEMHDALDVMRLDRVLEESPDKLNAQRSALEKYRQEKRSDILEASKRVVARIDEGAGTANSHVVLHNKAAKAISASANNVGAAVTQLHAPLGIDSGRQEVCAPRWRGAIRDGQQLRNAGNEAGPKLIVPAMVVGGVVLYAVPATRPLVIKALEAAKKLMLR